MVAHSSMHGFTLGKIRFEGLDGSEIRAVCEAWSRDAGRNRNTLDREVRASLALSSQAVLGKHDIGHAVLSVNCWYGR